MSLDSVALSVCSCVQPTYLAWMCFSMCCICLWGLLSLNCIVYDWRTAGLRGLSVSACPWHNGQAGRKLWFNAEYSLPACSLMDEWRWQEVKEMGGSPCFCADKPLIPFNKLSFPLCLFNQKSHTHIIIVYDDTLHSQTSVHSLILTNGRRRWSCRLYPDTQLYL